LRKLATVIGATESNSSMSIAPQLVWKRTTVLLASSSALSDGWLLRNGALNRS
jgi:hypothetical protein